MAVVECLRARPVFATPAVVCEVHDWVLAFLLCEMCDERDGDNIDAGIVAKVGESNTPLAKVCHELALRPRSSWDS
jgi:hypothetical protein